MGSTITSRVQNHRNNLRNLGFRPVQLWVRDTRSEQFQAECKAQSRSLRHDPQEQAILDWIDTVQDTSGWQA
jgi:hypothetical protein